MEYWEFCEKTEDIVQVMLPRIPQKFVESFEELLSAGETSMAVENLLWTLADDDIAVSPNERDALDQLVSYLRGVNTQYDRLTEKFNRLTIAELPAAR